MNSDYYILWRRLDQGRDADPFSLQTDLTETEDFEEDFEDI